MKKVSLYLVLVALGLSVSACGGLKQKLGIENTAPNEFMVTERAPLSLPPEYNLRPVVEYEASHGEQAYRTEDFSVGEKALLSKLR